MLSCDDAVPLIARAVDALLDQEDLDRLRAHLWQCGRCRMEVESHLSVKRVLAERPAEAPPAGLRERLRLRLDREARRPSGHRRLDRMRARFRLRSQMPPPARE
ncbi:MAG: zf-HC2 domain-containing protein [Vicinamibacteraceae bacterium]